MQLSPQQTELITSLESLLQRTGATEPITSALEKAIVNLVTRVARESRISSLPKGQFCALCLAPMQWRGIGPIHGVQSIERLQREMGKGWRFTESTGRIEIQVPSKPNTWQSKSLSNFLDCLCESCLGQIAEAKRLHREKQEQQEVESAAWRERQKWKTQHIAASIALNPAAKIRDRFEALSSCVSELEVARLKALPYPDFLATPYWEIVQKRKLTKAGFRCELCAKNKVELHVHHKTYANHGREHLNLDDLIVLCATCHARHHDALERDA